MLIGINVTFWITQDYSNHEEVSSPHHSRWSCEFCSDKVQHILIILHEDIKGWFFFKINLRHTTVSFMCRFIWTNWSFQIFRTCEDTYIYTPLPILETTDRHHYHLQVFDCRKGNKRGINAFSFVYFCSITYFHIKRQSKFMKH